MRGVRYSVCFAVSCNRMSLRATAGAKDIIHPSDEAPILLYIRRTPGSPGKCRLTDRNGIRVFGWACLAPLSPVHRIHGPLIRFRRCNPAVARSIRPNGSRG